MTQVDTTSHTLSDIHATQLDASAVTAVIRGERGYASVPGKDVWDVLPNVHTLGKGVTHIGLAFPIYRLGGAIHGWVLRPDRPRKIKGKTLKYEFPVSVTNVLDCLPRYQQALGDPTVPLWCTEGAKKADALASAYGDAIVPININGVWGWRGKNQMGGKLSLPDLEDIAINGRTVVLAFDSDVARNDHIMKALKRFGALLVARGAANVQMLLLPQEDNDKIGVDDYLAQGHTTTELEAHVVSLQVGSQATRLVAAVHPETKAELLLPHGYSVTNNILMRAGKYEPYPVYSGALIVTAIGTDLATGDETLTVRWNGRGQTHGLLTAPRAELATAKGVMALMGARGAAVHQRNAADVAAYVIEFAAENSAVLPRKSASEKLGFVESGLVLPAGSVGYAEPVLYAGRRPIRIGTDADAYPQALRTIATWDGTWATWAVIGLALASPFIARLRPRRNPALYLAGNSGTGKTTLGKFATGCYGDPSGQPFLAEAHRTTAAGYHQTLELLNGLPLLIDEAHTATDPKRLEALAYEFANGQSYTKGGADGRVRGGETLAGTLLMAGEAIPEFRHAGSSKRVLWIDCLSWLPLGAEAETESETGKARAAVLERAWEAGSGQFGKVVAERIWGNWETFERDYRTICDDMALQPLQAWRECLAAAAAVLNVAFRVAGVTLADTVSGQLLDRWAELLTSGQQATDPAVEAWERLVVLLAQSEEAREREPDGGTIRKYPGWDVLENRREMIACKQDDDDTWRVLTGAPQFVERVGKSAAQLYGRTWLRKGWIRPAKDGTLTQVVAIPHQKRSRALLVPVDALEGWS